MSWLETIAVGGIVLGLAVPASADQHGGTGGTGIQGEGAMSSGVRSGLLMPMMNPARGRELFASKGCVVCHAVNGVGGEDAPALDAMQGPMNPFDFAASMWRGAEAMIYLQQEEFGEQIEFDGTELADIIAFVHSPEEQAKFSEAGIPPQIMDLMHHEGDEETEEDGEDGETEEDEEDEEGHHLDEHAQ